MPLTALECAHCRLEPTPLAEYKHGSCTCLPEPVVELILEDAQTNYHGFLPANTYTPTLINGCLRKTYLQKVVAYCDEIVDRYPAIRGKIIHGIFEGYRKPWKKEIKLVKQIGDITMTGTLDAYNPALKEVQDYKSMSDDGFAFLAKGPKQEHEIQVNLYAWMADGGMIEKTKKVIHWPVEKLTVWYVGLKQCAKTGSHVFAKVGFRSVAFDLPEVRKADKDKLENYIVKKTNILQQAFKEGVMPPMIDKENEWMCKKCEVAEHCKRFNKTGSPLP